MTSRRRFGSIRRLPSGRYQAHYSLPGGRRVKAPRTFAQKLHAEAWLADRKRDIDAKLWNPHARAAQRTTFAAYAARWLTSRQVGGRGLRPRTVDHYSAILDRYLLPAFGERQLASISPTDVRDWYSVTLVDKPTARAHAYALLKTVLSTAVTDELIDANPCRIRGAGQTSRVRKIRPATPSELVALTDAMPERLKLTVPLATFCALRFAELIELRRADVDLDAEVLAVSRAAVKIKGRGHVVGEPKTAAGVRDVSIPPHLLPMIEAHLASYVGTQPDSLLFPSVDGGTRHLGSSTYYRYWNAARIAAGRPDLTVHGMRHTGSVLAALAGANLAELMSRLGQSSPQAALRYLHAAQGRDREIAALLSKMVDDTS